MIVLWLKFLIMSILVVVAGLKLSVFGDEIANKTGIEELLIGSILIAMATSLPELVTSISSSIIGSPDIAIGNVFGSVNINLLILVLADFLYKKNSILFDVQENHLLTGMIAGLLSIIAIFGIIFRQVSMIELSVFNIGIETILLFFVYSIGMKLIFSYRSKKQLIEQAENKSSRKIKIKWDSDLVKYTIGFLISSAVIFIAGSRLTILASEIVLISGIKESFMGSVFVAIVTSLPELSVTYSAVQIGAFNMIIGNVLGSNIFNITIIFFADIFYRTGSILGFIDLTHVITASIGLMMTMVFMIGLFYKPKKHIFNIGWESIIAGNIFLFGFYLIYLLGINI